MNTRWIWDGKKSQNMDKDQRLILFCKNKQQNEDVQVTSGLAMV